MTIQDDLIAYLRFVDSQWPGKSIESIVLKYGQAFPVIPKPRDIRKQADRACFKNAYYLAQERGWKYCEGFAISPNVSFPIQHAWAANEDGFAVDSTWRPEGLAYYGVLLDHQMVDEILLDSRTFGILDLSKPKFREHASRLGWIDLQGANNE